MYKWYNVYLYFKTFVLALILNIETATKNCSVSLTYEEEVLSLRELNDGNYSHSENLHVFIEEVLKSGGKSIKEIEAISVSKGPGSFTGLRIGVSAAKGLSYTLDIPLISVSTLTSLAYTIKVKDGEVIIPLLDARRMEVYSAIYDQDYDQIRKIKAEIIDQNSFEDFLNKGIVHFLGDGADKCKDILNHQNAIFHDDCFPSAKEMAKISFQKFKKNDFEDVAYFEPFYLKDFLITKSKKKLF